MSKGNIRGEEAVLGPGSLGPAERGRRRWRRRSAGLLKLFRDGKGDDVAVEATVGMFWDEEKKEEEMERGREERGRLIDEIES
jgi:hypothetical protein